MKRLTIAVGLLAALLAGPAFAQQKSDDPIVLEREQQMKDREEIDKRYNSTLKKTHRDAVTTSGDPWSNMRGAEDPKAKR